MAVSVKVGSFAKATGAAPASQAVTGVGFQPTAIILYSLGKTAAGSFSADYSLSIGFACATGDGSLSASGQSGVGTTVTSQRAAPKALTMVQYGEVLLAECDVSSFDADGFTLNWTTNDANAYLIGYIAFGGDITQAAILPITAPSTGTNALTGAGFTPSAAFLLTGAATAVSTSTAFADLCFGWALPSGEQAAVVFREQDNVGAQRCRSGLFDGGCYFGLDGASNGFFAFGGVRSFDADGISLGISVRLASAKGYVLVLGGGRWESHTAVKPVSAAPAQQSLHFGIVPKAILGLSAQNPYLQSALAESPVYVGIGAADATTAVGLALAADYSGAASISEGIVRTDALAVVAHGTSSAQHAVAGVPTFADPATTITWSTNDTQATRHAWLAVGDTVVSGSTSSAGMSWAPVSVVAAAGASLLRAIASGGMPGRG